MARSRRPDGAPSAEHRRGPRWRRWLVGTAAIVFCLGLGALAGLGWFLSGERYVAVLERELETWLGAEVDIGSSRLSLRRGLGLRFADVAVRDIGAPGQSLTAQRLDLSLDFGALWRGELLFRRIYCLQPSLRLVAPSGETLAPRTAHDVPAFLAGLFPGPAWSVLPSGGSVETEPTDESWFSPRLSVRRIVVDRAEIILTRRYGTPPVIFSNAGLQVAVGGRRDVSARFAADLGRQGEMGRLTLDTRSEDRSAAHEAAVGEAEGVGWRGNVVLEDVALRELGEWFDAEWPRASLDFSGSYVTPEAGRTRARGVLDIRAAQFPQLDLHEGRVTIDELSWPHPASTSEGSERPSPVGLFGPSAVDITALVIDGRIETLAGRLAETGADLHLSAGRLRFADGALRASRLAGRYGRSSKLTELRAEWRPRPADSRRPAMLELALAGTLNLADDFPSLQQLLAERSDTATLASSVAAEAGHIDVELQAEMPVSGPQDRHGPTVYAATLRWQAADLRLPEWETVVSDVNGLVRVTPQQAVLEDVAFRLGESRGVLNGEIFDPFAAGRRGRLHVAVPHARMGDVAALLSDDGVWPSTGRLDGELHARFGPDSDGLQTSGRLNLGHARVAIAPAVAPLDVGMGQVSWNGTAARIEVADGSLSGNRLSGSAEVRSFDPLDVSITLTCEDVDLEPVWRFDADDPEPGTQVRETRPDVHLDARCARVRYGDFSAEDVHLSVHRHARQVDFELAEAGVADGQIAGTATLWLDSNALSVAPRVSGADAGPFFALLGHPTDVVSGRLDASGTLEIAHWEAWNEPAEWAGELAVAFRDGVAQRIPILVRLWTALSLQSILSFVLPEIPGEGLGFSSLGGDLMLGQGKLTTDNLSLVGQAVRLDTWGEVRLRDETVDLTTRVIPLRGITSVVEKVPLAGKLVARSADELTALPFEITGSYAAPRVRLSLIEKIIPAPGSVAR